MFVQWMEAAIFPGAKDIISFNCALSACSEDLPAARRLLSALRFAGLQETPVTGHAVMRALGSASQWEDWKGVSFF